ncbi:MAG: Fe-S cluster assembly sulfur transfer protein SufU [Candidatus Zixiibacteriota bacterium]
MSGTLDDMYRDIIMDHYRSPRGKKPLEKADVVSDGTNPSCGDEITLQVALDNGTVKDVHVDCRGCAISIASGSMLAEVIKGKQLRRQRESRGSSKRCSKVKRPMSRMTWVIWMRFREYETFRCVSSAHCWPG